ncbi:MAG TPA: type II toxin-antitoxin system RelE/ParE family toxin [Syntrophobacteraceae bacterium]|nr:type II toxin-antitoxin system RelE/ParE family toxin [Syntrophobacteraceae bacterium]
MPPYDVVLTKTAQKVYEGLPVKLKNGIDRCFIWLENFPKSGSRVKRLQGQTGCYRFQVGGWRIVYRVNDELKEVQVVDIRPRGDVYKH